jgi:transposase-like protein
MRSGKVTDGMRSSKVNKERVALAVVVGQEPSPEGLGSLARSARESSGAVHSGTPATTASSVRETSTDLLSGIPDPEVAVRPTRRRFTEQYKQKIVREADACTEPGAVGSLLRREGLYSSLLGTWRRQRDERELQAFAPQKRGRKPAPVNPLAKPLAQSERENCHLKRQLKKAHLLLDLQKKVSEILGVSLEPKEKDETE